MAATCGWTRGLHEIKHDGGSCKREPAPQLAQPKNHLDELERNTRMSRLLVKCALLAAAIAGLEERPRAGARRVKIAGPRRTCQRASLRLWKTLRVPLKGGDGRHSYRGLALASVNSAIGRGSRPAGGDESHPKYAFP